MRGMLRLRVCCSLEGGDALLIEGLPTVWMLLPIFSMSSHCHVAFHEMNTPRSIDEDQGKSITMEMRSPSFLTMANIFDKHAASEQHW